MAGAGLSRRDELRFHTASITEVAFTLSSVAALEPKRIDNLTANLYSHTRDTSEEVTQE